MNESDLADFNNTKKMVSQLEKEFGEDFSSTTKKPSTASAISQNRYRQTDNKSIILAE